MAVEQVGGDHYQKPIQAWDYIVANKLGFLEGNVVKYISRWQEKDGLKDLEKCLTYVQKCIEVEKARLAALEPGKKDLAAAIEWTNWYSGTRPLSRSQKVEVVLRNGITDIQVADFFRWEHQDSPGDIVRYRLID